MSESNDEIKGYELNEEEWDLVDIFKNPDDLSKAEWQKKYPLKTKKDWDALEEEINKEASEMFPFSQAILKSTDLSSIPTEIYESAKLKLGIKSNSTKSVTLPSLPVIRFQPLSPKLPTAPDNISTNEYNSKSCTLIFLI